MNTKSKPKVNLGNLDIPTILTNTLMLTMKIRVRQAIAVALVATALASDRTLAAAAQQKPERLPESKNLVTRLTQHLRRVVVGAKIQMLAREDRFAPAVMVVWVGDEVALRFASRLNVWLLNLPPPLS